MTVTFVFGLALSLVMVSRYQVGGDQLHLLARGWLLADGGRWIQYGMNTSALGKSPGGLTSLLVGLPLMLWHDYRSPALLIVLFHVLAYFLLDRTLREILSARERLLFALLYWLNPWRVYFSGFLWDPNYLFLFGAVHTWTAFRQRRSPSFWLSFAHVLALGAFLQVHTSFVILVIASLLLLLRGYFRPHWGGVVVGALVIGASLIPWALEAIREPAILPGGKGFIGRGLIYVFPLLRGIGYWLRYGSFSLAEGMVPSDFSASLPPGASTVLAAFFWVLTRIVGPLTVLLPVLANWRLWRRERRHPLTRLPEDASDRAWLHGYVALTFAAALVSFCLSPTTIMAWQGFSVLHVAVLPLVLWLGPLWRSRSAAAIRRALPAYAALTVALLVGMAFGSPEYRKGGRDAVSARMKTDLAMLHQLRLAGRCSVSVDAKDGWLPDVLTPPPPAKK